MTTPALALLRAGSGPPLLLLHGIGSTRDDFATLLPHLTPDFDVLTLDLPGHGASPPVGSGAPTVKALVDAVVRDLDAHGLGRVHVLGNSLGARLALELARRGRASSVVALSPSGLALPAERLHQGLLMVSARLASRAVRPWVEELSRWPAGRTALLGAFRARPWQASEAEAIAVGAGFGEASDFWSTLWWSVMADVPLGLDEIDCPVVVAQGTGDVVGTTQAPRYLALLPAARLRWLPGAGHAPQSDTPAAIAALMRETAARAAGARSGAVVRAA